MSLSHDFLDLQCLLRFYMKMTMLHIVKYIKLICNIIANCNLINCDLLNFIYWGSGSGMTKGHNFWNSSLCCPK